MIRKVSATLALLCFLLAVVSGCGESAKPPVLKDTATFQLKERPRPGLPGEESGKTTQGGASKQ